MNSKTTLMNSKMGQMLIVGLDVLIPCLLKPSPLWTPMQKIPSQAPAINLNAFSFAYNNTLRFPTTARR